MFEDRYSKWLKKFNSYETCECCNGDKCPECHCYYAVLNLKSNQAVYFTCGRPVKLKPIKEKENANKR